MNPSRATLATTGLLLSLLAACTDQTVVPTEPSRVAPMPSIPGSSSVTVRTGLEAERYLEETAAAWSRNGDTALSHYLTAQKGLSVRPERRIGSRGVRSAPADPSNYVIDGGTDGSPSPTTTPDAEIYYSSTSRFLSGSSGTIVSSVTYYGNIAISTVTYSATDAKGGVVIPNTTVTNRGLGRRANCVGSTWQCSWTFTLQTVIALALGSDCGVTVKASASHTAQWTTPSMYGIPGATWGSAFATDPQATTSSPPCTPPATCLEPSASNYGGPLPCTYPSPPTGGDGSTPPTTGTPEPPTYQPAPFVPNGHWECYLTYVGTDTQTERCTWYADYTRLPKTSPAFALTATGATSSTQTATDLPSVFVIVSDQVPADAMAVIERHKQGPYKNVLLVPSSTIRPAVLVAALQALADSRGTQGETPAKDLQLTLEGGILDQQIPAATRAYAASFTALIANAKRGQAGDYGLRQVLELRLADRR